jgi:hypoxanthine-DNA glycosylase
MPVAAFPPIVGPAPRVLVLGSLPGARSLAAGEYYAHPRNAFWPIMGALVGAGPQLEYAARVKALQRGRIALWDVLQQAVRPGSADTAIELSAAVVNPVGEFLEQHRSICGIAFNGGTAARLFRRLVLPGLPAGLAALPQLLLPSTSPAHAGLDLRAKERRWSELQSLLRLAR